MICDLFSWVQIKSAINYEKRTEKTQNKTKQMLRSKNFRVEILFEGDVLLKLWLPEYADYPKKLNSISLHYFRLY